MDNNEKLNSCLMLAVNLDCPISLKAVFSETDLKDTGIELDSHITLLYAQGREIDKNDLLDSIKEILGDGGYYDFLSKLSNPREYKISDIFDLGSFENDSDYVVLKMKNSCSIYEDLSKINRGLRLKYDVATDFDDYTPHLTLAELQPGTAEKYLKSETLLKVLEDSVVNYEDIMVSYGLSNEPEDRKQYFLTTYHCVDRYFRMEHLRSE